MDMTVFVSSNVAGMIEGVDPVLKNEYVLIGAHSDHVGYTSGGAIVEHDSLKAYNMIARVSGASGAASRAPIPSRSRA